MGRATGTMSLLGHKCCEKDNREGVPERCMCQNPTLDCGRKRRERLCSNFEGIIWYITDQEGEQCDGDQNTKVRRLTACKWGRKTVRIRGGNTHYLRQPSKHLKMTKRGRKSRKMDTKKKGGKGGTKKLRVITEKEKVSN